MSEFSKGDIVCNKYAGSNNPCRYLMYLGIRENDPLYLVGHLPELHSFLAALRELKDFKEEEK